MQSSGLFTVNVTGNGTATLSEVRQCALELAPYVRDPAQWLGSSYSFNNFLDPNLATFQNLSGCAPQFIITGDRKLTLYASGWVCPQSTGAQVGAASPQVFTSFSTTLALTIALSFLSQLVLTTRRQ